MAKINRRYIDKHWLVFVVRGATAAVFSCLVLFGGMPTMGDVMVLISLYLLLMGIVDAVAALYGSSKKHGWINAVIDSLVDVVAAVALLFLAKDDLVTGLIIISTYTIISGIIDIFHGFVSTVDPTDRFIRILAGVCGCVIGFVIINAGGFELTTFARFFGAYMMIVGITSMIYGIHNHEQEVEDNVARSEARRLAGKPKSTKTAKTTKTTKASRASKATKFAKSSKSSSKKSKK